ncbi:MAG: DUF4342 domain-containing protein [Chloroflexi bacterium]|nr:DUF4342 domain-containing protein [Chloroflexota bacterium]
MKAQEDVDRESWDVEGSPLIDKVKQLVHEGNVRRIIVKQEGRTVAEFPLTFGVVGVVVAPVLAAIGALAALLAHCTIEVERAGDSEAAQQEEPAVTAQSPDGP